MPNFLFNKISSILRVHPSEPKIQRRHRDARQRATHILRASANTQSVEKSELDHQLKVSVPPRGTRARAIVDNLKQKRDAVDLEATFFQSFQNEPNRTYYELKTRWQQNPQFSFPEYANILFQIEGALKAIKNRSPKIYQQNAVELDRFQKDRHSLQKAGYPFSATHELIGRFEFMLEALYRDKDLPLEDLCGNQGQSNLYDFLKPGRNSSFHIDNSEDTGFRFFYSSQEPTLRYFNKTWILGPFSALFFSCARENYFDGVIGGPGSMMGHDHDHQWAKEKAYSKVQLTSGQSAKDFYTSRELFINDIYTNIDLRNDSPQILRALDLILFDIGHEKNLPPTKEVYIGYIKSYQSLKLAHHPIVNLVDRGFYGEAYRSPSLGQDVATAMEILLEIL